MFFYTFTFTFTFEEIEEIEEKMTMVYKNESSD